MAASRMSKLPLKARNPSAAMPRLAKPTSCWKGLSAHPMKLAATSPKNHVQDEIVEARQADREQKEIGEQGLDNDGSAARRAGVPERDSGGDEAQYKERQREVAEHECDRVFHRCSSTFARPAGRRRQTLERAAKEPQHLWRGLLAIAPGLLDRLARPEMPRPRYDDGAGKEAGLLQRGQECLRLRLRVDNVVIGAVDEQASRPGLLVLIDRGVADLRSVEIGAAALHGRHPEEFLGDLVARTGDLVVVPLRLHVVDAVEADDRLYVGGGSGVRVTAILSRKQGFVACERNERH